MNLKKVSRFMAMARPVLGESLENQLLLAVILERDLRRAKLWSENN